MTDNTNNISMTPQRPLLRGAQRYDVLREAEQTKITAPANLKELFTMTLTATQTEGASMDHDKDGTQFLIDLIFKPNGEGLKLRPEETQLLLAHISEILGELEDEEKLAIHEERAAKNQEKAPCR